MIQRKQTVFLFLSFVLVLTCLSLPIGWFEPNGMCVASKMLNLWIVDGNGAKDFSVWPLFAILLLTLPLHLFAIFDFHHRKRQMLTCNILMLLLVVWYVAYIVFSRISGNNTIFHYQITACFPFIAFVLVILAKRAIKADEALVRAADRIR